MKSGFPSSVECSLIVGRSGKLAELALLECELVPMNLSCVGEHQVVGCNFEVENCVFVDAESIEFDFVVGRIELVNLVGIEARIEKFVVGEIELMNLSCVAEHQVVGSNVEVGSCVFADTEEAVRVFDTASQVLTLQSPVGFGSLVDFGVGGIGFGIQVQMVFGNRVGIHDEIVFDYLVEIDFDIEAQMVFDNQVQMVFENRIHIVFDNQVQMVFDNQVQMFFDNQV